MADYTVLATPTDTVTSVSGRTGAITLTSSDVGLGNVENIELSTWNGSNNITTVGEITNGTWSANTIAVNKGGTGQTSFIDNQLLIGKTTGNTLEKVTLTAGNNITITNSSGTLTIESQNTTYNAATTEVEGLMSSSDKTKLDGIETGADVTDTANVTAAGALMDTEVTNLDQVKAFSSSGLCYSCSGYKSRFRSTTTN